MEDLQAATANSANANETVIAANQADSANANATVVNANEAANQTEPATVLGDKGIAELTQLRKERRELREKLAYVQGKADATGTQQSAVTAIAPTNAEPQAPIEPDPTQFADYPTFEIAQKEYTKKKDAYILDMATHRAIQVQERQNAELTKTQVITKHQQRIAEAEKTLPDLREVTEAMINDPRMAKSQVFADEIVNSEVGPQILHYLGTHLDEAIRISRLSPKDCAREIWKIESKFQAPSNQPVKISQAPDPVKALGGRSAPEPKDYEKMSTADFMKQRNAESPPRRR